MPSPLSHDALDAALAASGYFADETLVTALYLALELGKPLLLEGMPGVGKTEIANTLAKILKRQPIRLQCYEGIDASKALYDWDHARQLLHVRVAERGGAVSTAELYAPEFLIEMPLLKALRNAGIKTDLWTARKRRPGDEPDTQLSARARILAVVVFPTPRGPAKTNA